MRILLFSESNELIKILNDICHFKEACTELVQVTFDRIKTLGLTSKEDVYIIDDAYYETLDTNYLELLKYLKVDVIVLGSDLKLMKRYIGFNIVEYICGTYDLTRIGLCLQRLYKRNMTMNKMRLKKISEKILIRNKNEVNIISVKDVYFIKAHSDYVQVFTKNEVFVSIDTINYYEGLVTDSFFRVAKDVLVNFDKVDCIQKLAKEYYKLCFADLEHSIYMSDFLIESETRSEVQRSRQKYIIEMIKIIAV